MAALVVDATAAVKWFLGEPDSPRAVALLTSGDDLKAPMILRLEVASALTRAYRTKRMSRADTELALASAAQMLSSAAIELVETQIVQDRAEVISLDLSHPFLDCLYVALAEREGCELVTSDTTLLSRTAARFPFVRAL